MKIKVSAVVNKPIEVAWDSFNDPKHVVQWNHAEDTWHCPKAQNDLRVGGYFNYRMEAKDGSFGFDFEGTYDAVDLHQRIAYTMPDKRQVEVKFINQGNQTLIESVFDGENENSEELQRAGWQSILNNYKKHTESL